MTSLKAALFCYAVLMVGLTIDYATSSMDARAFFALALMTLVVALCVAAFVEGVAWVYGKIFK